MATGKTVGKRGGEMLFPNPSALFVGKPVKMVMGKTAGKHGSDLILQGFSQALQEMSRRDSGAVCMHSKGLPAPCENLPDGHLSWPPQKNCPVALQVLTTVAANRSTRLYPHYKTFPLLNSGIDLKICPIWDIGWPANPIPHPLDTRKRVSALPLAHLTPRRLPRSARD